MCLKQRGTEMCVVNTLSFLFTFCVSICLCNNHPVRRTKYGRVRGFTEEVYDNIKVDKFLGIPYARPPIGNLRFEAPVPPQHWNDILNAKTLSPACPQPSWGVKYIEHHVPNFNRTSEDCLYLNVYSPKGSQKNLPVLVFIHGGSYYSGMGAILDGSALATKGLVAVSINYRLGALGFLTSGYKEQGLHGNYGLLDLIAALRWVNENIVHFRGDPKQVTIDGHSAGGCGAGLIMMSPLAKGLFRRVIIQSGSPLAHWSVTRRPEGHNIHFKVFTSEFNCMFNEIDIKKCLQNIPTERMHHFITKNYERSPSLSPQFRPVVDSYVIPDTPEKLAEYGDFEVEGVMTGATKDEGLMAAVPLINSVGGNGVGRSKLLTVMYCFRGDLPEVPGIVESLLNLYTQWPYILSDEIIQNSFSEIVGDYYITAPTHKIARLLSRRNKTVYLYNYEYKSKFAPWKGVVHGAEVFYLSGCPLTAKCSHQYGESDKDMSRKLLELWSNFAKNGLPALVQDTDDEFYMPRYSSNRPLFTRISVKPNSDLPLITRQNDLKPSKLKFWNVDIPRKLQDCNAPDRRPWLRGNDTVVPRSYIIDSPNSWALIATCIGLSVLTILFSVGYCKSRRRIKLLLRQSNVPISNRML